jgi:hypothetical protein
MSAQRLLRLMIGMLVLTSGSVAGAPVHRRPVREADPPRDRPERVAHREHRASAGARLLLLPVS